MRWLPLLRERVVAASANLEQTLSGRPWRLWLRVPLVFSLFLHVLGHDQRSIRPV